MSGFGDNPTGAFDDDCESRGRYHFFHLIDRDGRIRQVLIGSSRLSKTLGCSEYNQIDTLGGKAWKEGESIPQPF
jgi:hypothetical protein